MAEIVRHPVYGRMIKRGDWETLTLITIDKAALPAATVQLPASIPADLSQSAFRQALPLVVGTFKPATVQALRAFAALQAELCQPVSFVRPETMPAALRGLAADVQEDLRLIHNVLLGDGYQPAAVLKKTSVGTHDLRQTKANGPPCFYLSRLDRAPLHYLSGQDVAKARPEHIRLIQEAEQGSAHAFVNLQNAFKLQTAPPDAVLLMAAKRTSDSMPHGTWYGFKPSRPGETPTVIQAALVKR